VGRISIFVDESGTLPDPKDTVIIIAAVGTGNPARFETIIKEIQKRKKLRKQTGELKFYTAGEKTKMLLLKKVVKEQVAIFVLIVDKMGRKIKDTPEHFAILCWLLLIDVIGIYKDNIEVVFDRHFSQESDIEQFNQQLQQLLNKKLRVEHVDSKKDKRVNIADMAAGSVLAKETGKSNQFYKLIERQIISEKRINWAETKRSIFAENKNLPEPV